MTLYITGELIFMIVVIVVGVPLFLLGCWMGKFCCQKECLSVIGAILAGLGGLGVALCALFLAIFLIGSASQRRCEPVTYQEYLMTQKTLQEAINDSEDIINTDLYLRAVDFNKELASIQFAQADSRYSMSFSGEVDWSKIQPINIE